jgi:hypothetical protein
MGRVGAIAFEGSVVGSVNDRAPDRERPEVPLGEAHPAPPADVDRS